MTYPDDVRDYPEINGWKAAFWVMFILGIAALMAISILATRLQNDNNFIKTHNNMTTYSTDPNDITAPIPVSCTTTTYVYNQIQTNCN